MTNKSPWDRHPETGLPLIGRPLTCTPLDYVPIDAPISKAKPTKFSAPTLRRAAIAAASFGGAVAAIFFVPAAVVALIAMSGAVWAGSKFAKWLDRHEEA